MEDETAQVLKELIERKKKLADMHRDMAQRAFERYQKHSQVRSAIEGEIMKLSEKLAARALKTQDLYPLSG